MLAAFVDRFDSKDPASVVSVADRPSPTERPGWVPVTVRATSINQHDVFTCRGTVIPDSMLPRTLGQDAAGLDPDGNEVVAYNVLNDPAYTGDDPLLDPRISGLSETVDGTFAEQFLVPAANLVPKPATLSFEEASCLPTAWLTAYRMLFVEAAAQPGDAVLVQGSTGGVVSALYALGKAAGIRMWATGRSAEKREYALQQGAEQAFEHGSRLPELVSAVMETVGAPTWDHSMKSVRKGGIVVVAGGTGGYEATTNIARLFYKRMRIVGVTMGTIDDFRGLISFIAEHGIRPSIGDVLPLDRAAEGIQMLATGATRGKVVLVP